MCNYILWDFPLFSFSLFPFDGFDNVLIIIICYILYFSVTQEPKDSCLKGWVSEVLHNIQNM